MIEIEIIENKGKDYNEFNHDNFEDLEIPETVSKTEAIIFDFVSKHYGINEARNPSWNISELAKEINTKVNEEYKQENTVSYEL